MKKIIFLLIITFAITAEAQNGFGNNGMQRQRQNQMMQTPNKAPEPDFPIKK